MKFFNPKTLALALTPGILVMSVWLPQAKGEIVYEEPVSAEATAGAPATAAPAPSRVEDRAAMRQAIQASENARTTVQAPAAAPAPAIMQVQQTQPSATTTTTTVVPVGAPATAAEVENVSKAELMRRERVRQELKNEDLLQERLEELRLRDEQRRTGSVLTNTAAAPEATPAAAPIATIPMKEEAIGTAATAPKAAAGIKAEAQDADEEIAVSKSETTSGGAYAPAEDKTFITVSPRFGMSSMRVSDSYQVNGHMSGGLALGADVGSNLGVEVGYTYSEYGIQLASGNPLSQDPNAFAPYGFPQRSNFENYALKQNVIDAGIKIYLLDNTSKFRPYIGGGAAYSKGYVNYNEQILNAQRQSGFRGVGSDYQISSYLGFLSTGADLKVSKSVSVGALFKYYAVLSSHENGNLNDMALAYGQNYGYGPVAASNSEKQALGGSLAQTGFYSILATATFTF